MAEAGLAEFKDYANIDATPEERERGITITRLTLSTETEKASLCTR